MDFFSCFTAGGVFNRLASIDEAAGKDPFPVTRIDCPTCKNDFAPGLKNRGSRDFGIDEEDEVALGADEPLGLRRLDILGLEWRSTFGAELIVEVSPARVLANGARHIQCLMGRQKVNVSLEMEEFKNSGIQEIKNSEVQPHINAD
jgi:hypothetical protein